MKTINYGGEYWRLHDNGQIERPGLVSPSDSWRVVGAVRLNNFGHTVQRFTLADVLSGRIEWKHKNGKQRVHILDFDHGTIRMWGCPGHSVS